MFARADLRWTEEEEKQSEGLAVNTIMIHHQVTNKESYLEDGF